MTTEETTMMNEETQSTTQEVDAKKDATNEQTKAENDADKTDENSDKQTDENKNDIPAEYNFEAVKLPEGMELDQDLLKEFVPIAKEDNLSQEQANRYMQLAVKLVEKQASGINAQLQQLDDARIAQYQTALNADKEIYSGDAKQTDLYLNTADKGYSYLSEETKQEIAKYGLNYSPAFIKDMHKLGLLFKDDEIPSAKNPATKEEDPAHVLFGNVTQE